MKHIFRPFLLFICCEATFSPVFAEDFPLIRQGKTNTVYLNRNEKPVVQTAMDMFLSDMQEVSDKKPATENSLDNAAIIVATIGKSKETDEWLKKQNISTAEIKNKWEAFKIEVIQKNNRSYLVVLGSDERGTAYGILELSRIIGVSP